MITARITYDKINPKHIANNLLHMFKYYHDYYSKQYKGEYYWKAVDNQWPKQQVCYFDRVVQ